MATEVDKTNIGVIATIVAVGTFAMIAVSLAVVAMVRADVHALGEEVSTHADLRTVRDLKVGQRNELARPAHWADRAKGLAAIPLDRAMSLVTQDLRKNARLATPTLPSAKGTADAGAPPQAGRDGGARPTEGKRKRSKLHIEGTLPGVAPQPTPQGGTVAPPPVAPPPVAPPPVAPPPAPPAPSAQPQ